MWGGNGKPGNAGRQADGAVSGCDDFILWQRLFSGVDSVAGAYFSARTAIDAGVGVDVIDFAFRDRIGGANGLAGAASNAVVVNNVSHCRLMFKN